MEPFCAWDGTTSCYALTRWVHSPCWTVISHLSLCPAWHARSQAVGGAAAGGGCFYQQPWSWGFSLISFSSFPQPWICIRSWVRTNLIPEREHGENIASGPANPPSQTVSRLGVLAQEKKKPKLRRDKQWLEFSLVIGGALLCISFKLLCYVQVCGSNSQWSLYLFTALVATVARCFPCSLHVAAMRSMSNLQGLPTATDKSTLVTEGCILLYLCIPWQAVEKQRCLATQAIVWIQVSGHADGCPWL